MIGETAKAMGAKRARDAMRVWETELWFFKRAFLLDRENSITYYLTAFLGLWSGQTTLSFRQENFLINALYIITGEDRK